MSDTSTTRNSENRRQALAWIARQLRWEQTLAELRADRGAERRDDEDRQAA
jgi:hypothetical protein